MAKSRRHVRIPALFRVRSFLLSDGPSAACRSKCLTWEKANQKNRLKPAVNLYRKRWKVRQKG